MLARKKAKRIKTVRLTPLKYRVLTILCWRCRGASIAQLAAATGVPTETVILVIKTLRASRLVSSKTLAVANFKLTAPLGRWDEGSSECDLGNMAWEMEQRWRTTTRKATRLVWATRWATRLVGGVSGGLRQPLQVQHDLGVAEIFVRRSSHAGQVWIGEDAYRAFWPAERNAKVPDAVILNTEEQVVRVIEFGGRYTRQRLEEFHRFWAIRKATPYEIW